MFNFVQNWFAQAGRPIGVDAGSGCLRMAQVQFHHGQPRLIAAASVDAPADIESSSPEWHRFFVTTARDLLRTGHFRGRQILLALPAAQASIARLSIRAMDKAKAKTAIASAVQERMGMDPQTTLIRIYKVSDQEAAARGTGEQDYIIVAAPRARVNCLLAAAKEANLDVIGMNVEPMALLDCYSHIYRRSSDATSTTCFVDIGWSGTRLLVARDGNPLHAGAIGIGGVHFAGAVSAACSISIEEAKLARLKISHADTASEEHRDKRDIHIVRPKSVSTEVELQRKVVNAACDDLVQSLIGQLRRFCDEFAARSGQSPIDRLIFVGGEAQNRALCRTIARALGVSAIVGDPLLRMRRSSEIGFESGINQREPQPAWAVAIGLSLGAVNLSNIQTQRQSQGLPAEMKQ
jgi:type IV pilus assembly protein PilM